MSVYSNRLAKLKKEIKIIESYKKKKRWKINQKIMIDFINGVTTKAEFELDKMNITLHLGDDRKGFKHILIKHYCSGCPGEISTMDILNIADVAQRGLKLANNGVTNNELIVYQKMNGTTHHKLILKPVNNGNFVVSFYKVG
jgi:hypothetical protein